MKITKCVQKRSILLPILSVSSLKSLATNSIDSVFLEIRYHRNRGREGERERGREGERERGREGERERGREGERERGMI